MAVAHRWVVDGERGRETHDGGVLDQHILEGGELGGEAVSGSALQLGEAVGHAGAEELDELRSEAVVEARVAVEGFGRSLIVDMAELVEGALEVNPGLESDGPEEGDGVDLAIASDEPALLGQPHENDGGKEFEQGVLEECRRKGLSFRT